jgi:hypothetical protein
MVSVSGYPNITDITLDNLARIIITPSFRWIIYIIALALVLYNYILEPMRFSEKKTWFGLTYKYENFIMMCFTAFFYIFVFLGLWLTIPFTDILPEYWYIPIIVFIFAIILHLTISTPTINLQDTKKGKNNKESLMPPPSYFQPKSVRKVMYYAILVLDIIMFVQQIIYAGIKTNFKTTVLHQFFLNRFGGTDPENMLNFATEWLGTFGILIDIYWIYSLETFSACKYGLPASWNV